MFFVILGVAFAVPKVLELTNRVLEEYIIAPREMKKAAKGEVKLYPVPMDLALTPAEMKELQENESVADILRNGAQRHRHIAGAGQANVCPHCERLRGN